MSDETSGVSADKEPIGNLTPSGENGASGGHMSKAPDASSTALDSCYSYTAKGVLVYTEPGTNQKFVLNEAGSDWVKKEGDDSDDAKDLEYAFDGRTYSCTRDGKDYEWDNETSAWRIKGETVTANEEAEDDSESELEDDEEKETPEEKAQRQYRKRKAAPGWAKEGECMKDPSTGALLRRDATDGMIYEFDAAKSAWFPRIDEDFMAQYQMNYGFTPDGVAQPTKPEEKPSAPEVEEKKAKDEKVPAKAKWFEEEATKSTKVYVSNLPEDISEAAFIAFMSKCGMIDLDIRANKPKVKLYRDGEGRPKGDGLCTYVKPESVALALQILDGSDLKGRTVQVERAKFEMKGSSYDPKLKPKRLKKKEMEILKKRHDRVLAWEPDKLRNERSKREKVIVVKNLFEPQDFDNDAPKILKYKDHLRDHCSRFGGTVRKVIIYDKNPEGVAQVFFENAEQADMAISMMNGRMFSLNQRLLSVETWDGKTKYKVTETDEEERERLAKWDKFLEEGNE